MNNLKTYITAIVSPPQALPIEQNTCLVWLMEPITVSMTTYNSNIQIKSILVNDTLRVLEF